MNLTHQKTELLIHYSEVFDNLHRQCELPIFTESKRSHLLRILLLGIGLCGIAGNILLFWGAVIWLILATTNWASYVMSDSFWEMYVVNILILLSSVYFGLKSPIGRFLKTYIKLRYPCKIADVFDELQAENKVVKATIVSIEQSDDITVIYYSFDLLGERVEGKFTTKRKISFAPGYQLPVMYLNKKIHLLQLTN